MVSKFASSRSSCESATNTTPSAPFRMSLRLAFADGQRCVFVRPLTKFVGDEFFTAYVSHRRQHLGVVNTAPPQLLFEHLGTLNGKLVLARILSKRLASFVVAK